MLGSVALEIGRFGVDSHMSFAFIKIRSSHSRDWFGILMLKLPLFCDYSRNNMYDLVVYEYDMMHYLPTSVFLIEGYN